MFEIGFIPHKLDTKTYPEFDGLPANVAFMSIGTKGGKPVTGTALYEPDFHTYRSDGHKHIMRYHNIYGGECYLLIAYDDEKIEWVGEKYVSGEKRNTTYGKDWKIFFAHLTLVGLAKNERCKFGGLDTEAE